MISFCPGPSKLWPSVELCLQESFKDGILSQNHRSNAFEELLKETEALFFQKLNVPEGYRFFVASSATEIWEILTQSFSALPAVHVFNGAFGEKWFHYAHFIKKQSISVTFKSTEALPEFEAQPIVCLTHNETSNGTSLSNESLQKIRSQYPDSLIFVDAVSSMAGIELPWCEADVWFASVQKCFGLPSGLALGVISPKALRCLQSQPFDGHYNSLAAIMANMDKYQTTHTPNVLGIFLLKRTLQQIPNVSQTHESTLAKYNQIVDILSQKGYSLHSPSAKLHSKTVFCVEHPKPMELLASCRNFGIDLGKGYGKLRESTFRIANFPAISLQDIDLLRQAL